MGLAAEPEPEFKTPYDKDLLRLCSKLCCKLLAFERLNLIEENGVRGRILVRMLQDASTMTYRASILYGQASRWPSVVKSPVPPRPINLLYD
jgi:hypothetical protein